MVSPMASTCDPYATKCTKEEPKILQVKRGQKQRNAPDSARKRRNRVRSGCWREVQRVRTDGKTGIDRHRTCLACRLGQLAAERHWRSLAPRHAVLEWMWENAPRSGKRPMSPGSRRKPQKGRCWFGAASYFWRRIVYRLPLLPSKEKHLRQEDGQADQDHGRVGPGGI